MLLSNFVFYDFINTEQNTTGTKYSAMQYNIKGNKVKYVANYGIYVGRMHSPIGRNAFFAVHGMALQQLGLLMMYYSEMTLVFSDVVAELD